MEQLVTLQKALEASGASPEEIAKALAQATSSDMSEAAVEELMDKALNNSSIDRDDFKSVSGLQQGCNSIDILCYYKVNFRNQFWSSEYEP